MLRAAAILCLLAGCDVVWRLDDVHGGSAAADAAPDTQDEPDASVSCAVADDFAGTTLKQQWDRFVDLANISLVQSEKVIIDVPANIAANAEAGILLVQRQTLARGAKIDVEIVEATSTLSGHVETYLTVRANQDNGYVIDVSQTYLELYSRTNGIGALANTRTYDPVAHRWWRFEHGPNDNDITFSTSPDRVAWFAQKTIPIATPLVDVEIGLIVGSYNGGASVPTRAMFDNFSVCGP